MITVIGMLLIFLAIILFTICIFGWDMPFKEKLIFTIIAEIFIGLLTFSSYLLVG